MIVDKIENIIKYSTILSGLDAASDFICKFCLNPSADGRYELGNGIFANVQSYTTKSADGAKFEAHRKYVDLQVVVAGCEKIGWAPLCNITQVSEEYSKGGDIAFYEGQTAIDTVLEAGCFALLFPWDAHMPCIAVGEPSKTTKIVVKIPY